MSLLLRPSQTTFHIILFSQISQVLAFPVNNNPRGGKLNVRAIAAPDLSGAAGKIAGGVFALILLSLVIGLGAASIAILGSTEWREFRDRKKPKVPVKDETAAEHENEEQSIRSVQSEQSESATNEKERAVVEPARRPRLTLKSFMPIDFNDLRPGWLTDGNKK